ncbi:HepT-like ribonuclease domain-containing protein [Salibacterium aidingense]|nr:HepT-like ribonuclease domain-containing protein [Salibacterium aidingense]
MNFEKFDQNPLFIDAGIRNLEVIGEAAKYISRKIRGKHP